MEAYKTVCPDCGHVRFWVGYKTGIGKTPEQLEQMHKESITCKSCGSTKATTELDHESENGQVLDQQARMLVNALAEAFGTKEK